MCAGNCAGVRELLGPPVTHLVHAVRSDDAIGDGDDGGDQREDNEDGVSGAELGADAEGFVEDDVDASKNAERKANFPPRMHACRSLLRASGHVQECMHAACARMPMRVFRCALGYDVADLEAERQA